MKAFLKILKVLCYLCSFPLFIVFAYLASRTNIEMGGSYGMLTYVSVIVPVVFSLIWALMVLVQELKIKKTTVNKAKKIRKQTTKQVVFSLLLCAGLMFVLDGLLPGVFPDLTSSTIYYEDVAESDAANNRAELNKEMLDVVTARSIMAGYIGDHDGNGYTQYYTYYKTQDLYGSYTGYEINVSETNVVTPVVMTKYGYYATVASYDASTGVGTVRMNPTARSESEISTMNAYFEGIIKKYCSEGMKNKEVASLVNRDGDKNLFASLNLSGYESWIGPWVDLANDGRMTIPVILNLIMAQRYTVSSLGKEGTSDYASVDSNDDTTRKTQTALQAYPWYNPATGKVTQIQVGWNVLDMMGDYTTDYYTPAAALALDLSDTVGNDGLWAMLTGLEISGMPIGSLIGTMLANDTTLLGTLTIPSIYYIVDSLLNSISYAVGTSAVAGTPVYVDGDDRTDSGWLYGFSPLGLKLLNADGSYGLYATTDGTNVYLGNVGDAATALGIFSNNYERGTIDYMRFAWTDANKLLFAITGLFAIRKTCYVFSAICVLMAVIIGAIRMKLYKLEKGKETPADTVPAEDETAPAEDSVIQNEEYETPEDNGIYQDPYGGFEAPISYDVPTYTPYDNN